jgi:hypothetical protein
MRRRGNEEGLDDGNVASITRWSRKVGLARRRSMRQRGWMQQSDHNSYAFTFTTLIHNEIELIK